MGNTQGSRDGKKKNTDDYLETTRKWMFAFILFLVVLVSGFISRMSLHILIWHLNPPIRHAETTISKLGGLLTYNCTHCSGENMTACENSMRGYEKIDKAWIWATFAVVVTPYFITMLQTLWRICVKFKAYKRKSKGSKQKSSASKTKWMTAGGVALIAAFELLPCIAVSILVFVVLPSFDPVTASVVYLTVGLSSPIICLVDVVLQKSKWCVVDENKPMDESEADAQKTRKKFLLFSLLITLACQAVGVVFIAKYTKVGWLIACFIPTSLFYSFKFFENFSPNTKCLRRYRLHSKFRTRTIFVFSFIKIGLTSVFVLVFSYAIHGQSLFGHHKIGPDSTCETKWPIIIAGINVINSIICYKSAKTACVIYCQKFAFLFPLFLIPLLTTGSLFATMTNPGILKLKGCDLVFSEFCLLGLDQITKNCQDLIIAFSVLWFSIIFINAPKLCGHGYRHAETSRIFVSPLYCGVFLEMSLLLNRRRRDDDYNEIKENIKLNQPEISTSSNPLLYACVTMWQETEKEMGHLIESIINLNKKKNEFQFQAHVFFDDAFDEKSQGVSEFVDAVGINVNEFVKTLQQVIPASFKKLKERSAKQLSYKIQKTPYGARIEWTLKNETTLTIHLKDKTKIRRKKRWSQVMYMSYILNYKSRQKVDLHSVYLLVLDGDVKFKTDSVVSLMRRMEKSPLLGTACGRIHPIGSGPMVWYQKFEYAVSHWLQKATEHVIGCVLCSPGCFSLMRGSALKVILKEYSKVSTEAQHFIKYEQGEDRWLCTLLLQNGYKIEYCAESDAYTFAPQGFYEFYNQRRRWTPSTMANILGILKNWKLISSKNENFSVFYILYQLLLFASTILTPGTIFLMIVGAVIVGFGLQPWLALLLNAIPVGAFLLMCLFAPVQRQLEFAAILSHIYAVVMVIVLVGVIKDAAGNGFCSMTTIFIMFITGIFVIAAALHPKEFLCIIPGLLYYVAIPSMSMLMFLYSVANLHNMSWGTREKVEQTKNMDTNKITEGIYPRGYSCSLGNVCMCICCLTATEKSKKFDGSNNGNVEQTSLKVMGALESMKETNQYADVKLKHLTDTGEERQTSNDQDEEEHFWNSAFSENNLKPLPDSLTKTEAICEDLLIMRNKAVVFIFLLNIILITVIFSFTQLSSFKDSLSIEFTCGGHETTIAPISVLFIVVFGFLLLIQFLCMLYHRWSTFVHINAETGNEKRNKNVSKNKSKKAKKRNKVTNFDKTEQQMAIENIEENKLNTYTQTIVEPLDSENKISKNRIPSIF